VFARNRLRPRVEVVDGLDSYGVDDPDAQPDSHQADSGQADAGGSARTTAVDAVSGASAEDATGSDDRPPDPT
jgi:hypothetical protein